MDTLGLGLIWITVLLGTVEIILNKVPANSDEKHVISIAVQKDGPNGERIKKIVKEELSEWERTCYIFGNMGKKTLFEWKVKK